MCSVFSLANTSAGLRVEDRHRAGVGAVQDLAAGEDRAALDVDAGDEPGAPGRDQRLADQTATVGAGHALPARTIAIASGASNPSTVAQAVVLNADALRPPERARRRVPAPRVAGLAAALWRTRDLRRFASRLRVTGIERFRGRLESLSSGLPRPLTVIAKPGGPEPSARANQIPPEHDSPWRVEYSKLTLT